jgi:hypothetical protein
MFLAVLTLTLLLCRLVASQIPSVRSFDQDKGSALFIVDKDITVLVDSKYEHQLSGYAQTFYEDLVSLTGLTSLPPPAVVDASSNLSHGIFLSINESATHTLFNHHPTSEGYTFEISDEVYTIHGQGAIGTWWGKSETGTL